MPGVYYPLDRTDAGIVLMYFIPALLAYVVVLGVSAQRPGLGRLELGSPLGLALWAFLLGFTAPVLMMNTTVTVACWTAQAVWLCFRARHEGYSDLRAFLIAMAAFVVNLLFVPSVMGLAGYEF